MRHGSERFYIKNEGFVIGRLFPIALLAWIYSKLKPKNPKDEKGESKKPTKYKEYQDDDDTAPAPTRLFCRLLAKGEQPQGEDLIRLGELMESEAGTQSSQRDTTIPAGYTYLGQFIDHDITLDRTPTLSTNDILDPAQLENFRSPALDLDSVYGGGPKVNEKLYEADGKTLKVGMTTAVDNLPALPNDLPRTDTVADIGDHRNDENLVVAQTHLAFIKFHNKKVQQNPSLSFAQIKREVVLAYQAIVLTDFLPRVLDQNILNDVIKNGRKWYTDEFKACMPIEFSVAAYRMGHSLIRPEYEWNRIFNTDGPRGIATLAQLFEFSGVSGSRGENDPPFAGLPSLPSNWVIDWRRFYDLPEQAAQKNFTRQLDANMALDLKTLPEFQAMNPPIPDELISLATRNLLRGRLLSLPSGQQAAAELGFTPLTADQIRSGVNADQQQVLRETGFDQKTPLWYYILREAKFLADGQHLGPVGSTLVAETFVGLIENSPINVLEEAPDLRFSMPELLAFVDDINPLGD